MELAPTLPSRDGGRLYVKKDGYFLDHSYVPIPAFAPTRSLSVARPQVERFDERSNKVDYDNLITRMNILQLFLAKKRIFLITLHTHRWNTFQLEYTNGNKKLQFY